MVLKIKIRVLIIVLIVGCFEQLYCPGAKLPPPTPLEVLAVKDRACFEKELAAMIHKIAEMHYQKRSTLCAQSVQAQPLDPIRAIASHMHLRQLEDACFVATIDKNVAANRYAAAKKEWKKLDDDDKDEALAERLELRAQQSAQEVKEKAAREQFLRGLARTPRNSLAVSASSSQRGRGNNTPPDAEHDENDYEDDCNYGDGVAEE